MLPNLLSTLKSLALTLGVLSLVAIGSAEPSKPANSNSASKPTAAAPKAAGTETPAAAPSAGAAPAAVAAEAPVTEKTIVYLAKSGSRYHVKGCKYLKNSGKQVTILDAMKQGYAPCNVCKAPHLKRQ